MMTNGINTQHQNQVYFQKPLESDYIYYKGHGQLEKSAAGTSALHVISHEMDHVAEFKAQANRDHAEIRSLDMKIDYEFRNGRMVAVGGKTSVTTEVPANKTNRGIPALGDESIDIHSLRKAELPSDGIFTQESKLKEKLQQIETEIDMSLKKTFYRDPNFKSSADLKDEVREQELKETKSRITIQLEELRNREFIEKSRSFMGKILKLQSNFKETLVKLGLMQGTGNHLDMLG